MAQTEKNLPPVWETWVQSLDWEDPLEKGMATTLVFLPGGFHAQRSLDVYNPWGCKESDIWYKIRDMWLFLSLEHLHTIIRLLIDLILILLCLRLEGGPKIEKRWRNRQLVEQSEQRQHLSNKFPVLYVRAWFVAAQINYNCNIKDDWPQITMINTILMKKCKMFHELPKYGLETQSEQTLLENTFLWHWLSQLFNL